jgi:hypothetical protein
MPNFEMKEKYLDWLAWWCWKTTRYWKPALQSLMMEGKNVRIDYVDVIKDYIVLEIQVGYMPEDFRCIKI